MIPKAPKRILDDFDWEDPFSDTPKKEEEYGVFLSEGKEIRLNEIQMEGARRGDAFLESDRQFFTLRGSAGTGKTTLAKYILRNQRNCIVTAPTHKAKKVVSRSTGFQGETIHKIVGLRPDMAVEEFTQSNVMFSLQGQNLMSEYKVMLIDEASMLPKPLVDLIKTKAKECGIKVIFMGDPRQLPPVKEKMSSVFTDPEIEQFQLEKVERQSLGNPLITLYDKIVTHIDKVDKAKIDSELHDIIPYDFKSDMQEGIGYYFTSDQKEFGSLIMPHFKLGEDLDAKVICWTNNCVGAYNKAIRGRLLGDGKLPVQVGEMLMAYKTVTNPDDWKDIWYENSADYTVTKVEEGYKHAENYDESLKFDIKGFFVTIEDLDGGRGKKKIFVVKEESYADFYKIEKDYGDFAKAAKNNRKFAWKQYYEYRNRFALIGDCIVDGKKVVDKDFDYGYAITTYKSQGSTYSNAFIVMKDILAMPKAAERNRHAYVALSRPRKGAYILI